MCTIAVQQESHVIRHVMLIPSTEHLFMVCLLPTHMQSLVTSLPFQVNLNLDNPSIQGEHELQVLGHMEVTPSKVHRFPVSLLPTQIQSLVISFPFFLSLNLKGESTQKTSPVGLGGKATGAGVTVVGIGMGAGVAGVGGIVVPMQLSNIPTPYAMRDII